MRLVSYLLLLLVVCCDLEDSRDVIVKVQLLQGLLDMLTGYCLLRILLGNLVCFGRDQGDELDAAFYQKVARVFGKSHAGLGLQDLGNDLLHGCWERLAASAGAKRRG